MNEKTKVFVTDAQQRKALAVVRGLAQRGFVVGTGDETRFQVAGYSRWCSQQVQYPSPRREPARFAAFLAQYLDQNGYDLLMPMDDASQQAVLMHRELFAPHMLPLMPSLEQFELAGDKAQLMSLAQQQGIMHPATWLIDDSKPLEEQLSGCPAHTVVRPRVSSGGRGIAVVSKKEELKKVYQRVSACYGPAMVQEYIMPGPKYDVALLYDRESRVIAHFAQRELRHFPLGTGPSTLQESVCRPDLVELAVQLLAPLRWQGIAEVEFMMSVENGREEPCLMEVNPRFWNSMFLATACGIDFSYALYCCSRDFPLEPITDYAVGRRCRWLWPGDLLHGLHMIGRGKTVPGFFGRKGEDIVDDIWDPEDPGPMFGLTMLIISSLFRPEMWRQFFFRAG